MTGPSTTTETPVHALALETFLQRGNVSSGLTADEAQRSLAQYGPNALPKPAKKSDLVRFLQQFSNPLVLALLAAALIALVVAVTGGHDDEGWLARYGDALAIFLIVTLNAMLGFYQERRAEAALAALEQLTSPTARVRRDGKVQVIPAADVTLGDVVELEAGDSIPADVRLVQTFDLACEESALTGESVATLKDALAPVAQDAPLGDRITMAFMGTSVVRGKARAVVAAIGAGTELGKISTLIQAVEDQKTPLEERLDIFGKKILWLCLVLSALLLGWGAYKGGRAWTELLLEAVGLAVAAIPEGLPAITTITLALGMQRMAKRGAIVRKLTAVETLGSASVIASDKTGTLTQNEMTVRTVYSGGQTFTVTGEGYEPIGEFQDSAGEALVELPAPLRYTLATAALCNAASLETNPETGRVRVVGDPTEGALLTMSAKGKISRDSLAPKHEFVCEVPFDSDRKRMTIITRDATGREIAHVKGSADVLLPLCVKIADHDAVRGITEEDRSTIQATADAMSAQALRVLAICRRVKREKLTPNEDVERELTFLGLVGMMDPPRAEVKGAVEECRRAGIRAIMITGDHRLTAVAIAKEIGLWQDSDEAITGAELAVMSDPELEARVEQLRVFARTTAEQKLRIVRALKRRGHIVAMTGDGVNDAPALREAHIGVAMGRGGTDVARQASELVLSDDNFATIVHAVREGRGIYSNIQKFIYFLLSANAGLLLAVFGISLASDWPPLTPLMLLWINLVTNGLPALALGVDPVAPNLMDEPPRKAGSPLLSARDLISMGYVGLIMAFAAIVFYARMPDGADLGHARSLAFTVLALAPLFHAWNCRHPEQSLFSSRPLLSLPLLLACGMSAGIHLLAIAVPSLRPVFRTTSFSADDWLWLLGLSVAVIPLVELAKIVLRSRRRT